MIERIKRNLFDSMGRIRTAKLKEEWFKKTNNLDLYDYLKTLSPDLKISCQIAVFGQRKCKMCDSLVILPKIYCCRKCHFSDPEYKKKLANVMVEKYGSRNAFQCEEFKAKRRDTMVSKYGTEHALRNESLRLKAKATTKRKYGSDYASQSDQVKELVKKNNIEKYGVASPTQTQEVKDKIKNTCLERYGVGCVFEAVDIKRKSKETMLLKYGVEHALQSSLIRSKIVPPKRYPSYYSKELIEEIGKGLSSVTGPEDPLFGCVRSLSTVYLMLNKYRPDLINSGCKSSQQSYFSAWLSERGFEVIDNDRTVLCGKEIDIFIPSLNIGFEFNGTYWHSSIYKDNLYHQRKSILAKESGVTLIHLYEFDGIETNLNIVNSFITREPSNEWSVKEIEENTFYITVDNPNGFGDFLMDFIKEKDPIKVVVDSNLNKGCVTSELLMPVCVKPPERIMVGNLEIYDAGREILEWTPNGN